MPLKYPVSYFAVVTDADGKILSRSEHELKVSFDNHQTTKVSKVRLLEVVPSKKDVILYVGFNLDEQQFHLLQDERSKHIQIEKREAK